MKYSILHSFGETFLNMAKEDIGYKCCEQQPLQKCTLSSLEQGFSGNILSNL